MVFIPRDPVSQNQFLVHDSTNGQTTATAGDVVSLSDSNKVIAVTGTDTPPYGFLMQNVKAESSAHPTGFRLPGDLGSSDAFTGDPVAVAHLGIWETTNYGTTEAFTAGDLLGVDTSGRVVVYSGFGLGTDASLNFDAPYDTESMSIVAIAQNSLTAAQIAAGAQLRIKLLI